ncbi:MAG TPA: DUF2269 family protein [Roseiflexaceae bacterium]
MLIMRMLHILCSIWFISGLLGRWLAYAQARRAADIQTAGALLRLSDRFERLMAIPGSQAVLLFGLLTAWLQGQPLLGALQGARSNWLLVSLALFVSAIPLIIFVLAPRRKRRANALEAALARGTITPELSAALADRAVIGSRVVEFLIVAVLVLMILKPF